MIYFLRGVSICLFIFLPPSTLGSIFFGASFGILWLSTVPATSGIVAHIFGTKYLGLLYGLVFLSHQIGSFFGAYLGGLFYDLYGSYDYAWYLAIALSIFAGASRVGCSSWNGQNYAVVEVASAGLIHSGSMLSGNHRVPNAVPSAPYKAIWVRASAYVLSWCILPSKHLCCMSRAEQ